jgi:Catalytic LigB subunit of aromatic ring-opening dioxygenase
MAELVLGLGTSHTPMLSIPAELWSTYAEGDVRIPELAYPPSGQVRSYQEGLEYISPEVSARFQGAQPFADQARRCQKALDVLADTLQSSKPDITIIISDDQDEWFYEHNMPKFAIYWGESVPIRKRRGGPPGRSEEMSRLIAEGYGNVEMDVPVPARFGRFLIEYLNDHDFDIAHFNHVRQPYGGRIARRYPTPDGELNQVRETPDHEQGLPHGFAFVVKRLFDNRPSPILPVFQNTCYPPNQPTPKRSFQLGQAIGQAVKAWPDAARVAVVASGGLSHFVVDEELDRKLIAALEQKDAETLKSLPRERLYSATSESLNWVAVGGAVHDTPLQAEVVDYVPVYRTPAGTGGGWTFIRWQ